MGPGFCSARAADDSFRGRAVTQQGEAPPQVKLLDRQQPAQQNADPEAPHDPEEPFVQDAPQCHRPSPVRPGVGGQKGHQHGRARLGALMFGPPDFIFVVHLSAVRMERVVNIIGDGFAVRCCVSTGDLGHGRLPVRSERVQVPEVQGDPQTVKVYHEDRRLDAGREPGGARDIIGQPVESEIFWQHGVISGRKGSHWSAPCRGCCATAGRGRRGRLGCSPVRPVRKNGKKC